MISAENSWAIALSIFLALLFHALPLPVEWRWYRPELVLLVVLYWALALPHRVGVISAVLTGFALDFLNGGMAGSLAAGMVVATLFVLLNYQRLRQLDGVQQSLVMALLVALALLIEQWLHSFMNASMGGLHFLYSVPLSALCWIPLRNLLRDYRRYNEVA